MATGNGIIAKVRRVLRDVTSSVQLGEYWSDAEILNSINTAQMVVFNILLKKRAKHPLQKLVSTQTTSIVGQTAGLFSAALPTDYAQYLSVSIDGEAGRVYLGGRGVQYLDVRHNGVAILGGNWYLMSRTLTQPGSGTHNVLFYYYKYPAAIAANGTTLTDFEEPVYDMITNFAVALCGQKEIHRGRDISKIKTVGTVLGAEDDNGLHYTPITAYSNDWNGNNAASKDTP